jgi:hypothetical protein
MTDIDFSEIVIGQYADYFVYDLEGLDRLDGEEPKPRILIGGKEYTPEEIEEERKTLRIARGLFGDWVVDRVKDAGNIQKT